MGGAHWPRLGFQVGAPGSKVHPKGSATLVVVPAGRPVLTVKPEE